jgi:hypothetical protein
MTCKVCQATKATFYVKKAIAVLEETGTNRDAKALLEALLPLLPKHKNPLQISTNVVK